MVNGSVEESCAEAPQPRGEGERAFEAVLALYLGWNRTRKNADGSTDERSEGACIALSQVAFHMGWQDRMTAALNRPSA